MPIQDSTTPADFLTYLRAFALTMLLASPLTLSNFLFLKHSGETLKLSDVVAAQRAGPVQYGAALMENVFRYKLELVRQIKPAVVVLGSCRVTYMPGEAFKASFVNAGASVRSFPETDEFLKSLFTFRKPKLLLLGVDYFWFNRAYPVARSFPEHGYLETEVTRDKLLKPWLWLFTGQMSVARYWGIVTGRDLRNPYTAYQNLGVSAIIKGYGFLPDGSHLMSQTVSGEEVIGDKHFLDSYDRLKTPGWGPSPDAGLDVERFRDLRDILLRCDRAQVPVVVYLTPVSPTIYQRLIEDAGTRAWLMDLNEQLAVRLRGREYYNFLDSSQFGGTDCECFDGHHPGNLVQYRLLRELVRRNPRSVLQPYVDLSRLDLMIRRFQGHSFVFSNPAMFLFQEKDFLDIGCRKSPIRPEPKNSSPHD